jgi:hypothetical protein
MQKLLECGSPRGCAQAPAQLLAYRAKVYLADQSASYCEALSIAYVVGRLQLKWGTVGISKLVYDQYEVYHWLSRRPKMRIGKTRLRYDT